MRNSEILLNFNCCFANGTLAKVKSPLDRFVEDNTNNLNTLQI